MDKLENKLADQSLYDESQQSKLQEILGQRDTLRQQIVNAEEEWMQLAESIDL